MDSVPAIRVTKCNDQPIDMGGDFVLYWMTAFRRVNWNFALERAAGWARELGKALVILEVLPVDYPWACERFHRFVLDGMYDKAAQTRPSAAAYHFLLEQVPQQAEQLLILLSRSAALVVTDDFPSLDHQARLEAAATKLSVPLETVDSNGLIPLRSTDRVFARALSFRRFVQQTLPEHLLQIPLKNPLPPRDELPRPCLPTEVMNGAFPINEGANSFSNLPIGHRVAPAGVSGGSAAASRTLHLFLKEKLSLYSTLRNHPGKEVTSGLSPYLHFGHISTHQIFFELMSQEGWSPGTISAHASGRRTGWWNTGPDAEAFLDQFITWRELGYNMASKRPDYCRYTSLPEWAQQTLAEHSADPRLHSYNLDRFEKSQTHDPLWNAAQRQLVLEGYIHNYLRMLWGKKILEWSRNPHEALGIMIELNNKYALDGSDPNSFSGIFWVLGRYDRPWGPERPIFGKIRYMASENTARKYNVKTYLEKYGNL